MARAIACFFVGMFGFGSLAALALFGQWVSRYGPEWMLVESGGATKLDTGTSLCFAVASFFVIASTLLAFAMITEDGKKEEKCDD